MKNLVFEELKKFSSLDVLNFLNDINVESTYIINQYTVITFNIEKLFSFNVYIPSETSILEATELKIHIFEMIWRFKKSYYLKQIIPKLDSRFINQSWITLFPTSLKDDMATVTSDNLLNIMKFVARLSRIKIFE